MLTRPRNAGLVTYRGKVVAKLPGETVLTEDEHARLLSLYAARRPGRPPSGAYLCSGVVTCGACGKPLAGGPERGLGTTRTARSGVSTCAIRPADMTAAAGQRSISVPWTPTRRNWPLWS